MHHAHTTETQWETTIGRLRRICLHIYNRNYAISGWTGIERLQWRHSCTEIAWENLIEGYDTFVCACGIKTAAISGWKEMESLRSLSPSSVQLQQTLCVGGNAIMPTIALSLSLSQHTILHNIHKFHTNTNRALIVHLLLLRLEKQQQAPDMATYNKSNTATIVRT